MFNYLAKCGWLFDGFFSRGQLAVEGLANSTIRRRIFGSGRGSPGLGGPSPRAQILRLIRKRQNPLNAQSYDASNRWQRGITSNNQPHLAK